MASATLPVLYSFRRCPYAMRARLALVAGEQPCELREVALRRKPPALLAASPKGTVPVLVTADGKVIEQSLDIMLWALRRHDPLQWLPADAGVLDAQLALVAACDGDFKQQLDRYKYPGRYEGSKEASTHRDRGAGFLFALDERLSTGSYLAGDRPGLVDAAVFPFVRQFSMVETDWFDTRPWPRLHTWVTGWKSSPMFAHVMQKYPAWETGAAVRFPPN